MSSDRKVKIASIVHSLEPGGAEVMACKLAAAVNDTYENIVVALDENGPLSKFLDARHVGYFILQRRKGLDLDLIHRLSNIFRRENITLVHAHQYTPFAYAILARTCGPCIPVLFTEHGRFVPDRRRIRRLFLNRLMLAPGDKLTAVGDTVAQALVKNEGFSSERITVIPNGVDTTLYRPAYGDASKQIRRRLELPEDAFIVVMVARLDPIKDHKTALRAFEHVSSHYTNARLLLVGDGFLREELNQYVASRGLTRLVRFCGQQENVIPYYNCADCFLLTSLSEGAPLAVLEAMSCGLPVVATACGDIPYLVEHGMTGFLAPVGDDALLAHYLLSLAHNSEMCTRMGMAARLVCEEKYSWFTTVKRYLALYDTMLRAPGDASKHENIALFR